ncbi:MAG: DM13 domain-containing protein [Proteobacteria bacterium]|nr:DM13 domain-containing protein [Pseudomonadota bacterium]MDA1308344.1 DM13 domain-containing protein [Pseudomonadota bacterium]
MKNSSAIIVALAASLILGGCSLWPFSSTHEAKAAPPSAQPVAKVTHAISGKETARGTFKGLNGHVTTGHASIIRSGKSWAVSLGSDFSFDGAPDPQIAFGNKGHYAKGTNFAKLRKNQGEQIYVIPKNLDVGDYLEVYVWCEKFTVPLGVARLKLVK